MRKTALFLSLILLPIFAEASVTIIWDWERLQQVKRSVTSAPDGKYKVYYSRLLREADKDMDKKCPTVTDKPMSPASGDKHDYMSMGRYWWPDPEKADGLPYIRRDGQTNPEINKYDRMKLGEMAGTVTRLSLAWYLSGQQKYADKAVEFLDIWFLNPKTRMNPNMEFGQMIPGHNDGKGRAEGIIDSYSFVPMIDGILLLEQGGAIPADKIAALRAWFSEYSRWMHESEIGIDEANAKNNHAVAYDVQLAIYAKFAGNDDLVEKVVKEFPERRIATQIQPDGSQPFELVRTIAFHYSVFNFGHFLDMCFIGRSIGVDIYSSCDNALRKAADFIIPYLGNEDKWPYKQIQKWDNVEYEFARQLKRAYVFDNDKEFLKLYEKYKDEQRSKDFMFGLLWE